MRIGRLELSGKLLVLIATVLALFVIVVVASGCSARIGPHEDGWLSWDVCGYEGGVAASITIMEIGARLGCADSPGAVEVEAVEPVVDEPTP